MHEIPGLPAGNPSRTPGPVRDPTVDRGRKLEGNVRPAMAAELVQEDSVLAEGLRLEKANFDLQAMVDEHLAAAPRDRVRVRHRRHDLGNAGLEDGGCAGRLRSEE